ncbi:MAG: diguanylate cyclase [Cyanobacteria bacterium P01_F01_bin.4]
MVHSQRETRLHNLKGQLSKLGYKTPVLGLIATAGIISLRLLGGFQTWELHLFDWLMRVRPSETTDPRVVIVGVHETDLEALNTAVLSDTVLVQLIEAVKRQNPSVIGLNLYRNLPYSTSPYSTDYERLNQLLLNTPNLIGVEKVVDGQVISSVAGNSVLTAADRVAASDVIADIDGRIRRGFLFPSADGDRILESLGYRVAYEFLAQKGIYPEPDQDILTLSGVRFPPIDADSGGYVNADSGGYQILLNWRLAEPQFVTISATELLTGQVPPKAFENGIFLIGSLQAADAGIFFTAYSNRAGQNLIPTHSIELHAVLASQILSAVLDQRPVLKTLSEPIELLMIWGFANLGLLMSAKTRGDRRRFGLTVVSIFSIGLASYGFLLLGWWLPSLPCAVAVVAAPLLLRLQKMYQLQSLSTLDDLTQLVNRRIFQEQLAREWARALRSQTPLSLILCDVDYFKRYNDTYGHLQGDDCLRQVALSLKQSVQRPSDVVARYGGEEFVILLPNTEADGAMQVARAIADNLQALEIGHVTSDVANHVTVSLGVTSVIPSGELSLDTLMDTADMGLYEAKRRGRNQIVLRLPWTVREG